MWTPSGLLREAWRNIGARQVTWAVIMTLVAAAAAALLGLAGMKALDAERQLRLNGSLVWLVQSSEEPLSGRVCERLVRSSGVAAAGGLMKERPPVMSAFPSGPQLSVYYVTPGAVRVFDPDAPADVGLVGPDLLDTQALTSSSVLVDEMGIAVVRVGGRLRDGIAAPQLASGIAIPVRGDADLDLCWVRFVPGATDQARAMLSAVLGGDGVRIGPVVTESTVLTPLDSWHDTAMLSPWSAAAVVAGLIGALITWTRRSELAVYRTFGTSRGACVAMLLMESLMLAVPVMTMAITAGIAACNLAGSPPNWTIIGLMARSVVATTLAAIALSTAASALLIGGNIASQLKDR